MYPFLVFGKLIALIFPLQREYDLFFFFPFYHTGGAEKVHALIAQSIGSKNSIIFFTRKSYDETFLPEFLKSGCEIKNISFFTDNKAQYFFNLVYRGIVAGYINRQRSAPLVFNGQCNFAYKLSPWIKKNIPQVELIHSFNSFSWIRLPYLPYISRTVMISKIRITDHLQQYQKLSVPENYNSRISYIPNGIDIPATGMEKDWEGPLHVLYAGRATSEKRVHLVAGIAEKVGKEFPQIEFIFMGDVENAIPEALRPFCKFLGTQHDPAEILRIYRMAHLLVISSSAEGFPMAIMEAMAEKCAILATPVGDIPLHVREEVNGFLFTDAGNEAAIMEEGAAFVRRLNADRKLLKKMGETNRQYALENFSLESFQKNYRLLIQSLKSPHA